MNKETWVMNLSFTMRQGNSKADGDVTGMRSSHFYVRGGGCLEYLPVLYLNIF